MNFTNCKGSYDFLSFAF